MNKNVQQLHAYLFLNPGGVSLHEISNQLDWNDKETSKALKDLGVYLANSGLEIVEHDNRVELTVRANLIPNLKSTRKVVEQLSSSAMEVLAVIAYQQPITKDEITQIRGVNSEQSIKGLLEKNLIESVESKKEGINYTHYKTTKHFLHHIGIKSISHLPKLGKEDDPTK